MMKRNLIMRNSNGMGRGLLIAAFLLALSLLQSLYYVEGRHRWAVEPILIAISGVGVGSIAARRHSFATTNLKR